MCPRAENRAGSFSPPSMALASSCAAGSSLPSRCRVTALESVLPARFWAFTSSIGLTPGGKCIASDSVSVMNSMVDTFRSLIFSSSAQGKRAVQMRLPSASCRRNWRARKEEFRVAACCRNRLPQLRRNLRTGVRALQHGAHPAQPVVVLGNLHPVKARPLAGFGKEANAAGWQSVVRPGIHFFAVDGSRDVVALHVHRHLERPVVVHHQA